MPESSSRYVVSIVISRNQIPSTVKTKEVTQKLRVTLNQIQQVELSGVRYCNSGPFLHVLDIHVFDRYPGKPIAELMDAKDKVRSEVQTVLDSLTSHAD